MDCMRRILGSGLMMKKRGRGKLLPFPNRRLKIATVAAGTSTTIYMDIIKYDDRIPESVFTTAYLETGRP